MIRTLTTYLQRILQRLPNTHTHTPEHADQVEDLVHGTYQTERRDPDME